MMKYPTLLFFVFFTTILSGQNQSLSPLVSGPMLGFVEHRSAYIWYEVNQDVKKASLRYWEQNNIDIYYEMDYKGELGHPFNPISFELVNLKMNTSYEYEIVLNNKVIPMVKVPAFRTKELWEYRKDAPDFSFTIGSCTFLNDETYDKPGKPYGQDPAILSTMGNFSTDFMIWLGDNLYYREADYSSKAGMQYRCSYNRKTPQMQPLLSSRPNFAIWDDHDYGPNDSNLSSDLKETSLELFKTYWGNKTYGEKNNPGIYSKFSWSDCDFFLTDNRYHRSPNALHDSINGEPNCDKHYFGDQQLEWLKNSLLTSSATFKFIASGSQVLNPFNEKECLRNSMCEFDDLLNFISDYKISGIVFLTGDRHYSEVIKHQSDNGYALYDITSSPITSGVYDVSTTKHAKNPSRVPGTLVVENNFTVINIKGKPGDRTLQMKCYNKAAEERSNFSINEKELK